MTSLWPLSLALCVSYRSISCYCRFPYPLQPDIQLIASLQRLGWEVDSSRNEVRHLNQWYEDLIFEMSLLILLCLLL